MITVLPRRYRISVPRLLRWPVRLVALALVLFAVLTVYKLTVLWDSLDAERLQIASLNPIEIPGPVLFISDLQLTSPTQRYTPDLDGVDSVVIVGDFFENADVFKWQFGNDDPERVKAGLDTFLPESFEGHVYWVSAGNHDPQLAPFEYEYPGLTVSHLGKFALFDVDGVPIVATHGHSFFAGVFGGGTSWFFDTIGIEMPLERIARHKLDLPEDTWLISAHSHVPAIDRGAKVANTGSFVGVPGNFFFRVDVGTGIRADDGEVDPVDLW